MKIKDLIQKLLEHDLNDYVRVEVKGHGTRTAVEIDDVLHINDEGDPHTGLIVAFTHCQKEVRSELSYPDGGWKIYEK